MSTYPLTCPVCGEQNIVSLQALAVRGRTLGRDIICTHCGADLFLNHRHPAPDASWEWELVRVDNVTEELRI